MCKTLRVLNAVRGPEIGIPLSIQQYKVISLSIIQDLVLFLKPNMSLLMLFFFLLPRLQELTAPVLVSRLINAHHHLLALRLSEYLGLNQVSYADFI